VFLLVCGVFVVWGGVPAYVVTLFVGGILVGVCVSPCTGYCYPAVAGLACLTSAVADDCRACGQCVCALPSLAAVARE
jgi:hypothetical protein